MKLLEQGGAHVLFAPEGPDMYPPGYRTYVNLNDIEETLEGKSRPGFFRGNIHIYIYIHIHMKEVCENE